MSDDVQARLLLARNELREGKHEKAVSIYEAMLLRGSTGPEVYMGLASAKLMAILMDPMAYRSTHSGVIRSVFSYYQEALSGGPPRISPAALLDRMTDIFGQVSAFLDSGDQQAMQQHANAEEHLRHAQAQQWMFMLNRVTAGDHPSKFSDEMAVRNVNMTKQHQQAHAYNVTAATSLAQIRETVRTEALRLLEGMNTYLPAERSREMVAGLLSERERNELRAAAANARSAALFKEECARLDEVLSENQAYMAQRERAVAFHGAKRYAAAKRAGNKALAEFHKERVALFGKGEQRHFDNELVRVTAQAKKIVEERWVWTLVLGGITVLLLWFYYK